MPIVRFGASLALVACGGSSVPEVMDAAVDAAPDARTCRSSVTPYCKNPDGTYPPARGEADESKLGKRCTETRDCILGEICASYEVAVPTIVGGRCINKTSVCEVLRCPSGSMCARELSGPPSPVRCTTPPIDPCCPP